MSPYNKGLANGTAAYTIWGVFGLYFTLLTEVPVFEVLAHRVIWCLVFTLGLIVIRGDVAKLTRIINQPKIVLCLALSSLLIGLNWGVYFWAVSQQQLIEVSLGYFLSPLISVLLGRVLLNERLSKLQLTAVAFASVGVLWQFVALDRIPWIAISLASLFGFYGLIRKQINVDSLTGLTIETMIIFPIALTYWYLLSSQGIGHFDSYGMYLVGGGLLTAVPLLFFAAAAKALPLSTLGFLNYIGPTLQMLSAIFILGEPFSSGRLISFSFIWIGLLFFSIHLFRQSQATRVGRLIAVE